MKFENFGYCDFRYQVKTKSENSFLFPIMIISAEELEPDIVAAVFNSINTYSCEFENSGITDIVVEAVMPYRKNIVEKIIEKSIKDTFAHRYLLYANLAVRKEICYRTLFIRAGLCFLLAPRMRHAMCLKKQWSLSPMIFMQSLCM